MHLILLSVGITLGNAMVLTPENNQNKLLEDHSANRTARSLPCPENEYPHNDLCCIKCPTGTHVSMHCTVNHGRGYCSPCTPGQDFTAAPNGMEDCLQCHPCRFNDQQQVAECTAIRDYQCCCKPNTFCTSTCLYCNDCTRCPEGQYVKHECTPTSDTVCEDISSTIHPTTKVEPDDFHTLPGNSQALSIALLLSIGIVFFIVAVSILVYWRKKQNENEAGSRNENYQRPPFEDSPETVMVVPGEGHPAQERVDNLGVQDTYTPLGQEDKEDFINIGRSDQGGETEPCCKDEAPCDVLAMDPTDEHMSSLQACTCGCDRFVSTETPMKGRKCINCEIFNGKKKCKESEIYWHVNMKSKSKSDRALTEQEWLQCYKCLKENVPPTRWKEMMRDLGLPTIDIETILQDHQDFREISYQMLWLWRNQNGQSASMRKVLCVLDKMKLRGCKENVANGLMSNGIHVV